MPKNPDRTPDNRIPMPVLVALIGAAATLLAAFIAVLPSLLQTRVASSALPGSPPTRTGGAELSPTSTYSAAFLALNVNVYPGYTVYWKRELWESAAGSDLLTEDFEKDVSDYGELSFPYLTGNGFLLAGQSSAQIADSELLGSGIELHFRDWTGGLTFNFPDYSRVSAFGFDYRPAETWQLTFSDFTVTIPKGRKGFVGIQIREVYPSAFVLSSQERAQGGLSIDNITYLVRSVP